MFMIDFEVTNLVGRGCNFVHHKADNNRLKATPEAAILLHYCCVLLIAVVGVSGDHIRKLDTDFGVLDDFQHPNDK